MADVYPSNYGSEVGDTIEDNYMDKKKQKSGRKFCIILIVIII